ncbi:DNA/RNA helicase domain-containing protein [Tunturiibacter lichenicola]|uniref:DNA/RNA helicase domain-containing protein n=1 Tax=Tunturiibacter lichenicola TaxID=2051959 RepID=UPI0028C48990|nr:DNA/RNA helicase domain-containing protein [Edaphobacter lichenicola]
MSEWITALETRFPNWKVHISSRMALQEYGSEGQVERFLLSPRVFSEEHLHLEVSMRSFRAEALSAFVGHVVANEPDAAHATCEKIRAKYPIYLTRNLSDAKAWLRSQARGTERFGLIASSGALRLRPEGIHIKAEIEPANWFLNESTDVRSSYYLEDVATEFTVQGLELDWVGVCWDGDFHHRDGNWRSQAFKGTKWQSVNDESRRSYLKNAYRVILTRARQGMIIFVPEGNSSDPTRPPSFYDGTYEYLRSCGVPILQASAAPNPREDF